MVAWFRRTVEKKKKKTHCMYMYILTLKSEMEEKKKGEKNSVKFILFNQFIVWIES